MVGVSLLVVASLIGASLVGALWTQAATRRAAAQVLHGASRRDRVILFWWRFLSPWTLFAGSMVLMTVGLSPAWVSAAALLIIVVCVGFVRPIRAFMLTWVRGLAEPWDRL